MRHEIRFVSREAESMYQVILNDFEIRCKRNPRYSMRSYARFLKVNPTTLCLYFNKKRQLSNASLLKIANKIGIPEEEAQKLYSADKIENSIDFVDLKNIEAVSKWYCFAILSIMELDTFVSDYSWIADRLGISASQVEEAIENMKRLNMVLEKTDGQLQATGKTYSIPDEYCSFVNRQIHLQELTLIEKSLETDPIDTRSASSITVATDMEKINEANKRIKKFRRKMMKFLESGKKKVVYKMCIQIFPVTRG